MIEGEKNLIEKAKQGDSACFGILYNNYLPQIYRFILLKVNSKTEAEDLTHEVFLNAWQNLPKYKDQGFPFSSWLYQIARNRTIDHFRTKKPIASIDAFAEEKIELVNTNNLNIDDFLQIGLIKSAIHELKEEHQNVLIMRFIEDMSPAQIANILGKSEGAIRLIQHRAILELRELLKGQQESENIV